MVVVVVVVVAMVMTDSRRVDREVTVLILHLYQNSTGLYEDSQAMTPCPPDNSRIKRMISVE